MHVYTVLYLCIYIYILKTLLHIVCVYIYIKYVYMSRKQSATPSRTLMEKSPVCEDCLKCTGYGDPGAAAGLRKACQSGNPSRTMKVVVV